MQSSTSRLQTVDAVRGIAMLFVCLSHFAITYLDHIGDHVAASRLSSIAMIASPTFVLLSGIMLGLIYARSGEMFAVRRRLFVERALFLLTVGHLLLLPPSMPLGDGDSVIRPYVTDAIGVAMLFGANIISRTTERQRLAIAAAIYLVSSVSLFLWMPLDPALRVVKDVFLGLPPVGSGSYAFALLPWTAVYLVGTVFGGRVAAGLEANGEVPLRLFAGVGAAATTLAVLVRFGLPTLQHQAGFAPLTITSDLGAFVLSPWQKYPPGPTYLLFFGGAGLLLMSTVFYLAQLPMLHDRLLSPFEVIGRTSLATFVVQQYVYFSFLGHVGGSHGPAWPIVFVGSLAFVWLAATWWDRRQGNRWLSLTALAEATNRLHLNVRRT